MQFSLTVSGKESLQLKNKTSAITFNLLLAVHTIDEIAESHNCNSEIVALKSSDQESEIEILTCFFSLKNNN